MVNGLHLHNIQKGTLSFWHLLRDSITLPVIAGLAVGIAFVLLLSFNTAAFHDTVVGVTRTGDLTITLAGLKDEYALDEPLNFTVNYKGDGWWCHDPTARILDADSGELAYDIPTLHLAIFCDLDKQQYSDITWTLYDLKYPATPLIIEKPGHYRLEVRGEGVLLEKDFIIKDNLLAP